MRSAVRELTSSDSALLQSYEAVIESGLQSFVEVGTALTQIRDSKLYRESHSSFSKYCEERWSLSKTRAYQLIESAEVGKQVSTIVDTSPANEAQARELSKLDEPDEQSEAWQEAVETAPKDKDGEPKITAGHVREVVRKRLDARRMPEIIPLPESCQCIDDLKDIAGRTFGTIYADPPWKYGNQGTRAATSNHYDTMTVDEIAAMPIADLAAEKSHLHLWTTNAFLFDAKQIIEDWGFTYKSCFLWVKPQMGIGNYWRISHEFMLLGVRGSLTFQSKSEKSWMELPREGHSVKPHPVRECIERASPGPYLELFGRKPVAGWTVYGNQIESRLFA
jgi:N6-adenosine-specific RNA methylase IME4